MARPLALSALPLTHHWLPHPVIVSQGTAGQAESEEGEDDDEDEEDVGLESWGQGQGAGPKGRDGVTVEDLFVLGKTYAAKGRHVKALRWFVVAQR